MPAFLGFLRFRDEPMPPIAELSWVVESSVLPHMLSAVTLALRCGRRVLFTSLVISFKLSSFGTSCDLDLSCLRPKPWAVLSALDQVPHRSSQARVPKALTQSPIIRPMKPRLPRASVRVENNPTRLRRNRLPLVCELIG